MGETLFPIYYDHLIEFNDKKELKALIQAGVILDKSLLGVTGENLSNE